MIMMMNLYTKQKLNPESTKTSRTYNVQAPLIQVFQSVVVERVSIQYSMCQLVLSANSVFIFLSWVDRASRIMCIIWPLVPKFAGSNPAEAVGFFRAKKSSARLPSEEK
jgi:hypothetical protein